MTTRRPLLLTLALVAGATTVGVAAHQVVSATVSDGERPVLRQITPCRLADTRPAENVGPRLGKLGATETQSFAATDGDCSGEIPNDAVGLSMNVTALGATALSFLTIWDEGSRPLAASLNPAPGEPPTPNAVVTAVDAQGRFNVYNNVGETHVVIDVNGYYVDHDHDDKYSTEPPGPTATTVSVGAAAFEAATDETVSKDEGTTAWITSGSATAPGVAAPVDLPDGATVTAATAYFVDAAPTASVNVQLQCVEHDGSATRVVANGDSIADPGSGRDAMSVTAANATVDNSACSYQVLANGGSWPSAGDTLRIRSVVIELS